MKGKIDHSKTVDVGFGGRDKTNNKQMKRMQSLLKWGINIITTEQ